MRVRLGLPATSFAARLAAGLAGGLATALLAVMAVAQTGEGLDRPAVREDGKMRVGTTARVFLPKEHDGFYNYAPTVIVDGNVVHAWWCQNREPYVVRDHIYYSFCENGGAGNPGSTGSSAVLVSSTGWAPPRPVLEPGRPGEWDSVHVCDPAVVAGSFRYAGEEYRYALFYTGTDQWDNNHNQIGVALAREWGGPWVRYAGNPIVAATGTDVWGVGQPSVVSIDGKGRLWLFYTRGDRSGTYMVRRQLDFSDLSAPMIGFGLRLPEAGLTTGDGSRAILHNGDLVYDTGHDRFFLIAPRHPFDPELPGFVSSVLQLASIGGEAIRSGYGHWQLVGTIGPADSGFPRNHNAALVRTPTGTLPSPPGTSPGKGDILDIVFTTAVTGEQWLWSYTLYEARREIPSERG